MANTIQLKRGEVDLTVGAGGTAAAVGEPMWFYDTTNGRYKFYIAKSGTAGDLVWVGAEISTSTSESSESAYRLMSESAIHDLVESEDTISEMNDTTISGAANGHLFIYDADSSVWENKELTGPFDIDKDGVLSVTDNSITAAMLAHTAVTAGSYTNTDLTVDAQGRITAASTGSAPSTITISANNSANETVYPIFVDGATGAQGLESDTGLTYNPSSGVLTGTRWTGAVTGNVTGDTSGSSGSCTGNAATVTTNANLTGDVTSVGNATSIAAGAIVNADVKSDAAIAYSKLGTIPTWNQDTTGNAATATAWASGRTISLTGDVTYTSGSLDGSGNVTGAATIASAAVHHGMLHDDIISGQDALTSGLASTDEFAISDAGTVKRMDVSVLESYLQSNLTFTTNTDVDVSNANLLTRLAALESSGGAGNENITIGTDSGDTIVITGNLQVSGTTTTVDSTTVNLNDHNIVLDSGNDTSAVVNGAGFTLEGGSGDDATFTYSTTGPQFEMKLGSSYEDLQVAKLTASSLDISGGVDVDGTMEADAYTVDGTTLAEYIADTAGAMFTDNTETGITATYRDDDNTVDLVIGTLNQDTTGTATNAAHVLLTDNESTNENNAIVFGEGASYTGNVGLESDGDFHYNPSSGTVTATIFKGNVDAVNGDFDGTLEADAITVGGTALNTVIAGVTVTNATTAAVATTVTITDNESTNENNALIFTAGGDTDGGNLGLESDGTCTYNPSTGKITATGFVGALTGNVTGNVSGTAATVTGAAQSNITSLGTLSTLTVDNININGNTITSTDSNGDITLTPNGTGEVNIAAGNLNYAGTAVLTTGAELNILDGGTSATSTTLASTDRMVMNDAGTMKQVALSDLVTYLEDGVNTSGFNIDGGAY